MDTKGEVMSKKSIVKLNQQNWIWWRQQLKYAFLYKGYNNLFNAEWTKTNKCTPKFIKANAFGMSTLLSTISEELQPVLLQKEYFLKSLKALSKACGKNSMVTLCQRLFELVNLTYDSNTSLTNHTYKFTDLYWSFQNCAVGNTFQMDNGEGAAAAILLMSIGQDSSLTGLVQTLYYATTFNLEQITNRLLIKDSRRTKKITDSTLSYSSGATPTCFNQGDNLEEKFKVFLDKYMKEYFANSHSANQAKEESHDNKATGELTEDNDGFYVQEDTHDQLQLMSLLSKNNTELIHDSGASRSTV
ncbi:hypothetical protein O181_009588 [Austropuccinia psidii MF-1]|uniref:Uncharacterized protein n=1 Tax=Austropuccinia psidii MF-1 TaxID=1389203 RepID=A0A9Q3BRM5_9BASI|nr:hypothetical protein [Austropuccinia psidii MF-1]